MSKSTQSLNPQGTKVDVVDRETLRALKDLGARTGRSLVTDLVELFRADGDTQIRHMRDCLAKGDPTGVARAAHAFKASAGNLGATDLSARCASLEKLAKTDPAASLHTHVEALHEAFQIALRDLDEYLAA